MIGLPFVYTVTGMMFAGFAWLGWRDRDNPKRWTNSLFWGLLAVSFLAGDRLGDFGNGLLVMAIAGTALVGLGGKHRPAIDPDSRRIEAARRGNRLFAAALIVPAVALIGALSFKYVPAWVETRQATLVALTIGVLIALAAIGTWLRPAPTTPLVEGKRLMDAVGCPSQMPQMLAALGASFAAAGVGDEVGRLLGPVLPHGLFPAVFAYGLGMALLTMLMGNAFAAFPVMTAAIGLPILIQQQHGIPAGVAALGMLTGFCGTLLTPMAANFNIVPAALLELRDRYGVIRAQAKTALAMFAINIMLLYFLAFPR
jgi:uncharacterized membrane protein